MLSVLTQTNSTQRVAILGTGGGGLARLLHEYYPESLIDTVDLRSAVIQIAYQYFGLPRSKRLSTHVSSAENFLAQQVNNPKINNLKYNLLFSDIYLADGLAAEQLNTDFLMHSRQLLVDNGWLVLNLWKEHRAENVFINHLSDHFNTIATSTTKDGNWLIIASPKADALLDKTECRRQAKTCSERLGFNLWQYAKGFYKH